jgi:hypothetical protein
MGEHMRTLFALSGLALAMMVAATGCAASKDDSSSPNASDGSSDDDIVSASKDPLAMPTPMLTFLKSQDWGNHHLEWHTVRQWDRLQASDQAWAKSQGWARADLMEGQQGNGLEFLAMHRVMIRILTAKFPSDVPLFAGWTSPPTDAKDVNDPCPTDDAFDPTKVTAIDKLMNHIGDFASDDELGVYVETSLRPTATDANARSTDMSAGLHNYIHNRFQDPNSKIDIGDPSVNLQNKRFWRLHGWIESRWTAFRALKGLTEQDPAYQAAIKKGEDMLAMKASATLGGAMGNPEPPPLSLRKFFAQDP